MMHISSHCCGTFSIFCNITIPVHVYADALILLFYVAPHTLDIIIHIAQTHAQMNTFPSLNCSASQILLIWHYLPILGSLVTQHYWLQVKLQPHACSCSAIV